MNAKAIGRAVRMSSEDRRASILDSACKLFADKGFRGTTTRELAAAVGVTEPVLYEHFKTKRDLYSAIIESKSLGGIEVLSALDARFRDTSDDRGFFQALADSILDWYTYDGAFIRLLLFSSLEGHELKDLFHERSQECNQIVSGYIERRKAEGAFRPEIDPRVAARGFFGMVAHYALNAVVFNVNIFSRPPREVIHEMVEIFLGGMCSERSKFSTETK
jgi:AcrR family transcriptional regulator